MSDFTQKKPLWQFTDDQGSFKINFPDQISRLYFPLGNESGLLSSISPDLHGDIKTGQNSFLTLPVTTEDLHNTRSNRNFWVYIEGSGAWSLTGGSSTQKAAKFSRGKKNEKVTSEAGMLWHRVIRENEALGLKSEITNFVPVSNDAVELMIVSLTNTGKSKLKITPTSAIPIFGKSADNLRDHHHVTSLLNRVIPHPAGVVIKPTMSFDERGHEINNTFYCVLGVTGHGEFPESTIPTIAHFIGEGGSLETPRAVLENRSVDPKDPHLHGKPAMGALKFKTIPLSPRETAHFVLILGITDKEPDLNEWLKKFGSAEKAESALKENKNTWAGKLDVVRFKTHDRNYDGWLRWVSLQPTLRKIFGCSFLPDFDYGRGGRGWRDLWQDCLALLLFSPDEARTLLINNFSGVRIDGSNATIIGGKSGEFIADRNNITRIWMDHGIWPYLALELYIHQSGDLDVLFENARYFRDPQQSRATKKDAHWTESYGKNLKSKKGKIVQGSVLEHLLVQHLVQFFNVGEHNHIRLENADWNDGLDMAYERGESVTFSTLYASNLKKLSILLQEILKRKGIKKIALAKELLILLDRVSGKKVNYNSVSEKKRRLSRYFDAVEPVVSGTKAEIYIQKLIQDLNAKSDFIIQHVRQKEWLETNSGDGLFNGYYDNRGRRVEGDSPKGIRMTLTGQVFPVMSGTATPKQIEELFKTTKKYLKDKEHGGFRLNTDFGETRHDLGRAFSFAYGEKENGAFFSHMTVMFASALYQRGFVNEGQEVLDSITRMCLHTEKSKIYPGIPEYFNSEGRGMYHYLTGSASWLVLTMLTQVFGVRGSLGDLLLAPKFTKKNFQDTYEVSVDTQFAGKKIKVVYRNPKKIAYEYYGVSKVSINGKDLKNIELNKQEVLLPKSVLLNNLRKKENIILVTLE